jgi:hypothetical protein
MSKKYTTMDDVLAAIAGGALASERLTEATRSVRSNPRFLAAVQQGIWEEMRKEFCGRFPEARGEPLKVTDLELEAFIGEQSESLVDAYNPAGWIDRITKEMKRPQADEGAGPADD